MIRKIAIIVLALSATGVLVTEVVRYASFDLIDVRPVFVRVYNRPSYICVLWSIEGETGIKICRPFNFARADRHVYLGGTCLGLTFEIWDIPPGVQVAFPVWLFAHPQATYPALAFIRGPLRRHRRRKRGLCVRCGYNLTGNVSGRCPECGENT